MGDRNGSRLARERRRENFGRKSISASLAQCLGLEDHHGSAKAARKLGCTARMLNNYLHGRSRFGLLGLVAESPDYAVKFAEAFLAKMLERQRAEKAGR